MTIASGRKLGRYEVRSQLGAGGMGEVYLALDTELDRTVAIKILPEALATDQQRLQRFIQEAKARDGSELLFRSLESGPGLRNERLFSRSVG